MFRFHASPRPASEPLLFQIFRPTILPVALLFIGCDSTVTVRPREKRRWTKERATLGSVQSGDVLLLEGDWSDHEVTPSLLLVQESVALMAFPALTAYHSPGRAALWSVLSSFTVISRPIHSYAAFSSVCRHVHRTFSSGSREEHG